MRHFWIWFLLQHACSHAIRLPPHGDSGIVFGKLKESPYTEPIMHRHLMSKLSHTRALAGVALVFVVLSQFAMISHSVLVEHSPGEECEICIGQSRTDDALVVQSNLPSEQSALSVPEGQRTDLLSSQAPSVTRSRGPPVI